MIPQCYTLPEVAALLNLPKSTLYRQAREGRLQEWMCAIYLQRHPVVRVVFPKHAIDAAVEGGAAA